MIRKAVQSDVVDITHCVNEAYQHYISRIGIKPAPMTQNYAEVLLDNTAYVVDESEIIAVLVLKVKSPYLLIENVAVLPDYQGKGIGKQLFKLAERVARIKQC